MKLAKTKQASKEDKGKARQKKREQVKRHSKVCECNNGNQSSTRSLSAIYSELDQVLDRKSAPWSSKLALSHISPNLCNVHSELLCAINSDPSCVGLAFYGKFDFCKCLDKRCCYSMPIFSFDNSIYPVTGGFSSSTWNEPKNKIMLSALERGFKLFCNGK